MFSFQNYTVVMSDTLVWYSTHALKTNVHTDIEFCEVDILIEKKRKTHDLCYTVHKWPIQIVINDQVQKHCTGSNTCVINNV